MYFSGSTFFVRFENTRKSFRELYGTVFGPEAFSGLLRNACLTLKVAEEDFTESKLLDVEYEGIRAGTTKGGKELPITGR